MVALIDECLEKEICFTQETTLSGRKTLNTIKRAVAKYKNGELQTIGRDSPKWLVELLEKLK